MLTRRVSIISPLAIGITKLVAAISTMYQIFCLVVVDNTNCELTLLFGAVLNKIDLEETFSSERNSLAKN